jgi:ADP-heptose:LPS heptosyltransferase
MIQIDAGQGWPLTQSIAMFANATMHIGIDSFCNHLTNYYWTDEHGGRRVPGVVLWGSTQASAAGYPGNVNISKGLPCQPCFRENPAISRMPRDPCVHVVNKLIDDGQEYRVDLAPAKSYDDPRPHYCMDAITVDEVVEAVRETWRKATQ